MIGSCILVCAFAAPATAAPTLPAGFDEVTVATGLGTATDAAVTPDGRIVSVEKAGKVRVWKDGTSRVVLDISAHVNSYSDRGLLGVAVDKDFAQNGWVYLLYVYEHAPGAPSGRKVSRLTRITIDGNGNVVNPQSPETTILGKSASNPCPQSDNTDDCIPADYYWHTIGSVRVDPVDGTLWVGTGDATYSDVFDQQTFGALDENTYRGKILHVSKDGQGLAGHPFCPADGNVDHICTKVYAKGLRNPFRFSLRPGKGPIAGDVGSNQVEEVNLIQPGANYGWPCFEGSPQQPLYRNDPKCQAEYAKTGADSPIPPAYEYAHEGGGSVTGGPAYAGDSYPPEYRGSIFIADYVRGWVKRLEVDASGDRVTGVKDFASYTPAASAPAFVDVFTMPNGNIGYVDLGWNSSPAVGKVKEFRYAAGGNRTPVASASGNPIAGGVPLNVAFDASASSDPDGDPLTYAWDFGDGATGTGAKPTHSYASAGSYTARVTVSDSHGATATADVGPITPGNTPPVPRIASPADRSTFRYGTTINLSGAATDTQDGNIDGSKLTWTIRQQHGTGAGSHTHDFTSKTGANVSFDPGTDHDADAYFTVTLTATDSKGSPGSQSVRLDPETISLTLASAPSGAPVQYGNASATAPDTRRAAIGYRPSIVAGESFTKNRDTYRFTRWADSATEPRQRTITLPATDTTYTAQYTNLRTGALIAAPATPGAPLAPQPGTELVPLVDLRLPVAGLQARPSGVIKISLRNRNSVASRGLLKIVTAKPVRRGRGGPKRIKLGQAKFLVAPRAKRAIKVKLSPSKLKLLKRLRRVTVTVAWAGRDGGGRRQSGRGKAVLLAP